MFETSERQRSITVGKIPSSHQNTVEHRFNESIYQYKEVLGISKVFLAPKNPGSIQRNLVGQTYFASPTAIRRISRA